MGRLFCCQEAAVTIPLIPSRPHVNPNTSLLSGMTREQAKAALAQAQQALIELQTGKQVASVSYSQGDGSRSVSYRQANIADLTQLIRLLQAQAGIPGTRRAALRPVF